MNATEGKGISPPPKDKNTLVKQVEMPPPLSHSLTREMECHPLLPFLFGSDFSTHGSATPFQYPTGSFILADSTRRNLPNSTAALGFFSCPCLTLVTFNPQMTPGGNL